MDTEQREAAFEANRGGAWPEGYRSYREQWSALAKTQTVSDYPLLVDVELASVCNLRCPMCYTVTKLFKEQVNTKLMDWDLYTKIIDEVAGKVPALRLSLRGEATLHKKFAEAIRYAKDRGIKEVSTLTHGGKLKGDFMREIIDAGIDWITISIDGTGKTYEKIRKPIKFEEVLNNVKGIKAYKDEHGLTRPVIKIQGIWPAISEDPQLYYDTFAPHVDLVAFNPLIDYLGNDTQISYLESFCCPQQYQRLVIGADGLVMKCSNDEENREVVGDVKTATVHKIWHGEEMAAVREVHKRGAFMESPVCRKCYLPRETQEEKATVNDREITVHNYVFRKQMVGQ